MIILFPFFSRTQPLVKYNNNIDSATNTSERDMPYPRANTFAINRALINTDTRNTKTTAKTSNPSHFSRLPALFYIRRLAWTWPFHIAHPVPAGIKMANRGVSSGLPPLSRFSESFGSPSSLVVHRHCCTLPRHLHLELVLHLLGLLERRPKVLGHSFAPGGPPGGL